jgi:hypothetical protein
MTRLLAALALLVTASTAHAQNGGWTKVDEGSGVTTSIDAAHVTRSGGAATVVMRRDYATPRPGPNGTRFERMESTLRFDCASHTFQETSQKFIAGGVVVASHENARADFQRVRPGGMWEKIAQQVCR